MEDESEQNDDLLIENTNVNEWSPEHEEILIEWADKAMCYRWLHSKSNAMYSTLNAWYTIPVIIISTLTGTANFAQERVPFEYQGWFAMTVGGFNILAGIITTIQQFLKITQLNESHRVSSIAWDKFYRNVKIELTKHPSERIDPRQMLKMSKEEFDRLIETSPNIPEKIVQEFKIKFFKDESFDKIIKPEICDILIPTSEYRNPWYNEDNQTKTLNETLKNQLIKQNKIKKQNELNKKNVNDFIKVFHDLNNRDPMDSEIIDNLKDKMDINTIKKIVDQNRTITVKTATEESIYDLNIV
jgi:hypothetical protein